MTDNLYAWNYQNDDIDFVEATYEAWVGQYNAESDAYYVYVDTVDITALGAASLTVASIAAVSMLAAAF